MSKKKIHDETGQSLKALEMNLLKAQEEIRTLQNSQKRFLDLIDNAMVGIYRTTEDGEFALVNRKLAKIFGFKSLSEFQKDPPNVSQLYVNPEERRAIIDEIKEKGFIVLVEEYMHKFLVLIILIFHQRPHPQLLIHQSGLFATFYKYDDLSGIGNLSL